MLPSLYGPIAILRFAFIILGGSLGLYGVMLGACLLLVSIAAMNIQSIPFLAPISPFSIKAMRDVFVRDTWTRLWKGTFTVQGLPGSKIGKDKGETDK